MRKYRNVPVTVDGRTFSSKAEAKRYVELRLLEKAGKIANLELQPRIPLRVNGIKICSYVADFRYLGTLRDSLLGMNRPTIVEDVKGVRTPVYRLKKKLMKALHNIDIVEIG